MAKLPLVLVGMLYMEVDFIYLMNHYLLNVDYTKSWPLQNKKQFHGKKVVVRSCQLPFISTCKYPGQRKQGWGGAGKTNLCALPFSLFSLPPFSIQDFPFYPLTPPCFGQEEPLTWTLF